MESWRNGSAYHQATMIQRELFIVQCTKDGSDINDAYMYLDDHAIRLYAYNREMCLVARASCKSQIQLIVSLLDKRGHHG